MYDPTFFHYVSKAIHEDILRQAAARYRVQEDLAAQLARLQEDLAAQPARPYPQLSALRRLGQALWRAVPARLSSGR
jgi:hypothetical protein